MHNLAITLKQLGYEVSGSDDKIYDPSRSRLEKQNLLPDKLGWNPNIINKEIDFIVLGMHANKENPRGKFRKLNNLEILNLKSLSTSPYKSSGH